MKLKSFCPHALALASSLTIAAGLMAAPAQPQASQQPGTIAGARANTAPTRQLVTLKFAGGTVADYVKSLSKAGLVNVSVRPRAETVAMPAVELTNADPEAAIEVVSGLAWQDETAAYQLNVSRNGSDDASGAKAVYVIDLQQTSAPRSVQRIKTSTLVENVADLIETGMKPDDVLKAIETAVSMFSEEGGKGPDIRFHEPTGLIIARGNHEHMDAIAMVISSLRDSPALERRKQTELQTEAMNAMSADRDKLQGELKKWREQSEVMTRDRTEAMVRLEATTVELHRLRQQLQERESQLEMLRQNLSSMQQTVENSRHDAEAAAMDAAKAAEETVARTARQAEAAAKKKKD